MKEKEMGMVFLGELECPGKFLMVYNDENQKFENFCDNSKKCSNAPAIFKPLPFDIKGSCGRTILHVCTRDTGLYFGIWHVALHSIFG